MTSSGYDYYNGDNPTNHHWPCRLSYYMKACDHTRICEWLLGTSQVSNEGKGDWFSWAFGEVSLQQNHGF